MTIFMQIFWGSVLLVACSFGHMLLLAAAIKLFRWLAMGELELRRTLGLLQLMVIGFAFVLAAHTIQVWAWAVAFKILGAFDSFSDSIYFAMVTYTTVGYGDLVVGPNYRIFGAMAGVTGLLNFGLSTAFLVGLFERQLHWRPKPPPYP
ncbi:MAG: potassium channel family protein [Rhizobiaceae bacterium]